MKFQWLDKVYMWVVGFRNLSYCGQDTNAAIEDYHGFAKSILKSERSRMTSRRVDWCITALTEDVVDHYWYKDLRKEKGFVDNKKGQDIVVSSILRARKIPDKDVTLPENDGDTALVTSTEHRHLRYTIHNPGLEWAVCNCVWAQHGNMCKHHVKVVMMMNSDVAEGTIARFCGRLAGSVTGGLHQLLTPHKVQMPPTSESNTPFSAARPTSQRRKDEDPAETLRLQVIELHEEVDGDSVMIKHLIAELNRTLGRLRKLKAEIKYGSLHPLAESPVLQVVDDGQGSSYVGTRTSLRGRSIQRHGVFNISTASWNSVSVGESSSTSQYDIVIKVDLPKGSIFCVPLYIARLVFHSSQVFVSFRHLEIVFAMFRAGFVFCFELPEWVVWLGVATLLYVMYTRRMVQTGTLECCRTPRGSRHCRAMGRRRRRPTCSRDMRRKTFGEAGVSDASPTKDEELLSDRSAVRDVNTAWVLEQYYGVMADEEFQNLSNFSAA